MSTLGKLFLLWGLLGSILIEHVRGRYLGLDVFIFVRALISISLLIPCLRSISRGRIYHTSNLTNRLFKRLYSRSLRYLVLPSVIVHRLHCIVIHFTYQIILRIVCS